MEEVNENNHSIDIILSKDSLNYKTPSELKTVKRDIRYWLKFDLSPWLELFDDYDTLYLNTNLFEYATYYIQEADSIKALDVDYFTDKTYKNNIINRSFFPFTKSQLINEKYIVIKVWANVTLTRLNLFSYYLNTSNKSFIHDFSFFERIHRAHEPVMVFIGLAVGLFIINILLYFTSFNNVYLYYGLFLLFQIIYYSNLNLAINTVWEYYSPKAHYLIYTFIQVAINLFYLLFIRSFLTMKADYPMLNKAVVWISYLLIAFIVLGSIGIYLFPHFGPIYDIMNWQRYFMSAFALYGIVHLYINRASNLVYFVIIGTFIFVSGALTALFLGNITYMMMGAAIESLVFITGLAYAIQFSFKEKIRSEKSANRANESALRAQLNPHFIFNSLNSIQHLITKGDKENALRYLTKFSRLLRQILENSIEVNVPLNREVELLTMYLELESLRFNKEFNYKITIDNELDEHNLEVPLFLIQPFVENAIIHGLLPKQVGNKSLDISFHSIDDMIKCTITDSGIGRGAAKKQNEQKNHVSRGISVSEKRLEILNKGKDKKTTVNYHDLPEGTQVELFIPKN